MENTFLGVRVEEKSLPKLWPSSMIRRTNKLVFILTKPFQPNLLLAIKAAAHPSASDLPTDIRQVLAKNRTDVDKNLQGI